MEMTCAHRKSPRPIHTEIVRNPATNGKRHTKGRRSTAVVGVQCGSSAYVCVRSVSTGARYFSRSTARTAKILITTGATAIRVGPPFCRVLTPMRVCVYVYLLYGAQGRVGRARVWKKNVDHFSETLVPTYFPRFKLRQYI